MEGREEEARKGRREEGLIGMIKYTEEDKEKDWERKRRERKVKRGRKVRAGSGKDDYRYW